MGSLIRDFRYSYRLFVQNPGFAAVVLLSLGLGIGACTTIFSVFSTMLLRPLPFRDPDRLVMIRETNPKQGQFWRNPKVSTFVEWSKKNQSFEQMGMCSINADLTTLSGSGGAERGRVQFVTFGLFPALGVTPIVGRGFVPEDVPSDESTAVVISNSLWQRRFGADPKVVGQTFTVLGKVRTIIGVMPPGFWVSPGTKDADVWIANNLDNNLLSPDAAWFIAVGRLRPHATIEQAQAELDTIARRLELARAGKDTGSRVTVVPMREGIIGASFRNELYVLFGAVGFVLLIGCANVAGLLLARAGTRQKEIAVRVSLGAGRLRLIRQLLTESATLALLGGGLGLLLSLWGVELFAVLAPRWFPLADEIRVDGTVLGFTLGISLVTGVLFGLVPALRVSRPDLHQSLKEGGRRSTGGSRHRGHSLLVVSEIALALVLLVGAGLMINSLLRLQRVDLGFKPENLLTAEILLEGPEYKVLMEGDMKRVTPQGAVLYQRLLEGVRSLPGVTSADIISRLPTEGMWTVPFTIVGHPVETPAEQPQAAYNEVSPGLFRTMGIPLLRGRGLTDRDVEASPWVVVINQAFARKFFPDENPIGKALHLSFSQGDVRMTAREEKPREIVGVAGNVRQRMDRDPAPAMYSSYRQHLWEFPGGRYQIHLGKSLAIRTTSNPMSLASALRRIVAEVDKDQALYDVVTMEERLSENLGFWRFYMRLYGLFAGLAVILAAVGIYGVTSYSVGQRTHEFGIRMALGAQRGEVLKMVLREGIVLAGIGLAIGVAAALGLARLIANRLYGVTATDPLTFVAVSLTLLGVALLACYVPARRAARVDPMVALRYE